MEESKKEVFTHKIFSLDAGFFKDSSWSTEVAKKRRNKQESEQEPEGRKKKEKFSIAH